ncbi:MAG TPA: hypothetical protein VHD91_00265 [Gaiellaceae bacterium]|nr:hypothetical protein [Gaiellaceae bacterium]
MRGRLVIALGVLALLPGSSALASARAPAGEIVFSADHSPLWGGEIYRVGLDGTLTDLSRSIAHDASPAVSPDGKLVAFLSDRSSGLAVYVVRLDGTGLRRISPVLFPRAKIQNDGDWGRIAWAPDGTRLAAALWFLPSRAWVGDLHGHGRLIRPRVREIDSPAWSPDGRELATVDLYADEVDVRSPAGKILWYALGDSARWSATGRLAVRKKGTVAVYDERGRKLSSFFAGAFAWSPDGSLLASQLGKSIQIRRGGVGKPIRSAVVLTPTQARWTGGGRNGSSGIEWLAGGKLRVDDGDGWAGFDAATGEPWTPPAAFSRFTYPPVLSPDGSEVAVVQPTSSATTPVTLQVASLADGAGPVIRTVPPCPHDDASAFGSLQFTPGGGALVYQSDCPPTADLYRVEPGGKPQRLTATVQHETAPAVSPDGTRIAYARADSDDCRGCPSSIWVMNADGTDQHQLTDAPDTTWDTDPSWSPDGTTILYWHSTIDTNGYLAEIPAAGGAVTKLPFVGLYPAWGPSRIAYEAPRTQEIRTAKPDGSDVRNLGRELGFIPGSLAWSRGGRLAFLQQPPTGGALTLVVADGTTLVRHPLGKLWPSPLSGGLAWSPDGTRLAFTATDARSISDVWTVAPDGTHLRRVTRGVGAVGGGLDWH